MEFTQSEYIELLKLVHNKRVKLQSFDSSEELSVECALLDNLYSKLFIHGTAEYITEKKITNYLPVSKSDTSI